MPSVSATDIFFDHVNFAYGEETVLDGVSFTAKTGQITALVRPSGSGKSTRGRLMEAWLKILYRKY